MASLFGGLLKRVIKVKIDGNITQDTTNQILRDLSIAKYFNPSAVAIVINSHGGSLVQAKNISELIKQFSERKNVPIYCFAEDACLGSANVLLTTGVKSYATDMTLLGDFAFSWSSLWFHKFAEKYNIKQEFVFSGANKVKFNPFEEIKPDSQKWMQNFLYLLEHDLKVSVTQNRQKHFLQRKMSKEDIEQKVFKGLSLKPQTAVETGFIDGFKTFDELMNTTFSGTKVFQINKRKGAGRIFKQMSMEL